ncbi:uncharacterized protein LOC108627233 [Ceratina calcarata]|uniref:Uncharacterized protein LOC108627233 n=1 Tax=Ceratina calcarata TaxID=156304 RepID=A0AAJ7J4K2_9HYME|nr:uncharacterized protein LOC108627233 [Ceratina calcarata]
MHPTSIAIFAIVCCCLAPCIIAEGDSLSSKESSLSTFDGSVIQTENEDAGATLNRQKRTLFLKKKLIGAGLLGFGLGLAKGYKAGYYTAPEVHHVYLSPPPASVKYVEYVEKPVFVERIIKPIHAEYNSPPPYGAW